MEASEPKCVNPVLNIIGVNSLRLGVHNIILARTLVSFSNFISIVTKKYNIIIYIAFNNIILSYIYIYSVQFILCGYFE